MVYSYKKLSLVIVGVLALLVVSGYLYQTFGLLHDNDQIKPPGKLFKVNNYQMHLYCTGSGSPTVILEAASGGLASSWGWIQPEIAKKTRVCSYDRRGRGWSTGDSTQLDTEQVAKDLHAVLWAAEINDKYILVGHSIGGIYARKYQERYPEDVVGLVLVDASHPNQLVTTPQFVDQAKRSVQEFNLYAWLSRIGIFRLYFALDGTLDFSTLPDRDRKESVFFWSQPEHFESMAHESAQVETIFDQAQELGRLDPLPVRIISAADTSEEWERLQNNLFTLSADSSRLTVPDSTHMSLVYKEDDAKRVSTVIISLVSTLKKE